jgi:hypothetical protein
MPSGNFEHELDGVDRKELWAIHYYAIERYSHYRKRGWSKSEAFAAAKAWGRNTEEQAERRNTHDTGAERRCPVGSPLL